MNSTKTPEHIQEPQQTTFNNLVCQYHSITHNSLIIPTHIFSLFHFLFYHLPHKVISFHNFKLQIPTNFYQSSPTQQILAYKLNKAPPVKTTKSFSFFLPFINPRMFSWHNWLHHNYITHPQNLPIFFSKPVNTLHKLSAQIKSQTPSKLPIIPWLSNSRDAEYQHHTYTHHTNRFQTPLSPLKIVGPTR